MYLCVYLCVWGGCVWGGHTPAPGVHVYMERNGRVGGK